VYFDPGPELCEAWAGLFPGPAAMLRRGIATRRRIPGDAGLRARKNPGPR